MKNASITLVCSIVTCHAALRYIRKDLVNPVAELMRILSIWGDTHSDMTIETYLYLSPRLQAPGKHGLYRADAWTIRSDLATGERGFRLLEGGGEGDGGGVKEEEMRGGVWKARSLEIRGFLPAGRKDERAGEMKRGGGKNGRKFAQKLPDCWFASGVWVIPIWGKGRTIIARSPDQRKCDIKPPDERQILMLNLVRKQKIGSKHDLQIIPQNRVTI